MSVAWKTSGVQTNGVGSVALPTGRSTGDIMLLVGAGTETGTATPVSSAPSGWTEVPSSYLDSSGRKTVSYYRVVDGTETAPTSPASQFVWKIHLYGGFVASSATATCIATNTGTGTAPSDPGGITIPSDSCVAYLWLQSGAGSILTTGSMATETTASNNFGGATLRAYAATSTASYDAGGTTPSETGSFFFSGLWTLQLIQLTGVAVATPNVRISHRYH